MGFITINRKIFDHFLWSERRTYSRFEAWLDLIQLASYTADNSKLINGIVVKWGRGEYPISRSFLSKRWCWSDQKVRTFITLLKRHNQVDLKTTNACTILKLCNYDTYNTYQPTEQPSNNQRTTSEQPAGNQKYNKGNNTISEKNVIPPTVEMVTKYCSERKNGIDPTYFIDWYTTRGWMVGRDKMKDWQSAIRTWEKKNGNSRTEPATIINPGSLKRLPKYEDI
jgi:hypothetical protein